MAKRQERVGSGELGDELVAYLVAEHRAEVRPALERLWDYYRNEQEVGESGASGRGYRLAQERGLPLRLRQGGAVRGLELGTGRKEIVIENDIAWRIHAMVDFMFGKGVAVESLAADREKAGLIEEVLGAALAANGGPALFQDVALLGAIYGYVDLLLRVDRLPALGGLERAFGEKGKGSSTGSGVADRAASRNISPKRAIGYASQLVLETVEAPRAIPVLDPCDYRRLVGYILHYPQQTNRVERGTFLSRLVGGDGAARGRLASVDVTEVWTAERVAVYHDGQLVSEQANVLGELPLVHIQNLPQPLFYEGLGEVEPLIPLQDELNTRLSDRANRVTLQSFKMYLGKGIEGFVERPVGPGQMWMTDNPEASIEVFGGDGPNPSEDAHISEVREAMDKTSSVTPLAAGVLRDRLGNLTSENALRIVLMGLLAKTEKKRQTYGRGIEQVCGLILKSLDVAGVLETSEEERKVKLHWPSALPENEAQRLAEAKAKLELGVSRRKVLAELGYAAEE